MSMNKNFENQSNRGFTLVELAIVLLIVGLLIGGLLSPLSTRVEQKERQATTNILENIRESLLGFTVINGRLPCPAGSDGVEVRTGVAPNRVCSSDSGNLPWNTLGVAEFDSWDRPFIYKITLNFGQETNTSPCGTATNLVAFELCSLADNVISTEINGAGDVIAENIPAVVLSRGRNNDCSPLEAENDDGTFCPGAVSDEYFASPGYNQTLGGEFDDLIIWLSPNILKYRMVQAGRLP